MRVVSMALLIAVSSPAFATEVNSKPASADGAAIQPAAETAKSEDPAERKICRRIDASESRVTSKRVCLTEEQWKQREEDNSSL
jgi:uncharacterized protein YcfJ